ncbi:nucleoside triphosphate pyrophosphohydrolase family protein [Prauserella flavalba]|uniref:hypothetical protein n=1 Tax=Prauserella flavalba TaxID=1477506 RepID=UPI0036E9EDAD
MMLPDYLHSMLDEAHRLRQRFARTAPQQWTVMTAATELSVQLGHLALCMLRGRGHDVSDMEDPERPITNLGDELADVVLAVLSIAVLANTVPTPLATPAATPLNADDAFFRLLVAAGELSEAALVEHGYRHRPTGTPRPLADAVTNVLAACDTLATRLGIDLGDEFDAMVVSADAFLDDRLEGGDGVS